MGTRADFYKNIEPEKMEWLGSIAWDGYPEGIEKALLEAKTEERYLDALNLFFSTRADVTLPDRGWPWPWDDSQLTDYSYTFDSSKVLASNFGNPWFDPLVEEKEYADDSGIAKISFPDMSKNKKVRPPNDPGSGIMMFQQS